MVGGFPFNRKQKTTGELEEENERLTKEAENEELRLTIAQKQALYRKLDNAGLTVRKDFGGSLARAWRWLNKTK
jgi:hypothetical protein